MARKEQALQYAQDSANRTNTAYVIYQVKNNQWLYCRVEYYEKHLHSISHINPQYVYPQ